MENKPQIGIRDLYPNLTEDELVRAEQNLEQYLALVLRIFEREEARTLTPDNGTLRCTLSGK